MLIKSVYLGLFGTSLFYKGMHRISTHPKQYCTSFVLVTSFDGCKYTEFKGSDCQIIHRNNQKDI